IPALRRFLAGEGTLGMLRSRQPRRLRETQIEGTAIGRLVRDGALEQAVMRLVFVESEMDKGANPAPALRGAVDDGVPDGVAERIGRTLRRLAVAQEGDEVARRGETEPDDGRILRAIDQLVDVIGVEAALQADALRIRRSRER